MEKKKGGVVLDYSKTFCIFASEKLRASVTAIQKHEKRYEEKADDGFGVVHGVQHCEGEDYYDHNVSYNIFAVFMRNKESFR